MVSPEDTRFAKLVSLAVHDLRTPLATIFGFARTLTRMQDVGETTARYLGMVEIAAQQLGELLDELGLAARIEARRYEPTLVDTDTADLARAVTERLGEERVEVGGAGGTVRVDRVAIERAVSALAQCALRHGGLEQVSVRADGPEISIEPITPSAAPVVLGEDLRDLGAAVAVDVVTALGGSVTLDGERLFVRFAR